MSFSCRTFFFFALISTHSGLGNSVDLTCPTAPITINTFPNGSFPNTGGVLAPFPANYVCSIKFEIPSGYVVKFFLDTTAFGSDSPVITDSLSTLYSIVMGQTTFYAPANTSTVRMKTTTNTSSLYFTWEYQDVSHFGQFQDSTGYVMKMELLPKYSYLFTSSRGPITFHTASLSGDRDPYLSSIYVYDGADLNAPFMGNLYQLSYKAPWVTTGKNMVLVNYYNRTGPSYGIANDYDAISNYTLYNFNLLTTAQASSNTFGALLSYSVASTYYCIDCTETYITSLTVNQYDGVTIPQLLTFQPLSPTLSQRSLLAYTAIQPLNQYMPQQIPGRMFTMIASSVTASFNFVPGPFADWGKATPGRKGTIFSPSLWDPISPATYSTNFTASGMSTFAFTLASMETSEAEAKIHIEVGSPNSTPVVTEFCSSTTNGGSRSANGTYMSTTYTGKSNKSSFVLQFDIESTDPSLNPSTTTRPVITTTRATSHIFDFKVVLLVLTFLKIFIN